MAQQSYKKFVASAATATLVASALIPVASASEVTTSAFTDVAPQYKDAVDFVVSNNISSGYSKTQFGVNMQIDRGDAAVWIANAAGLMDKDAPASGFSDVPTRGSLAINSLKAAGVINGKTTTNFGFYDKITRGEAAMMLQKAFDLKTGSTDSKFTDVATKYKTAVDALVANNVTNGINATQFGTNNNIKRGDFAKFLFALKDQIIVGVPVETVSVQDATTLKVTVKDADKELVAKDFKVSVDGSAVEVSKAVADADGKNYTLTIPTLDGKQGIVTVNGVQADFNFGPGVAPQILGVTAVSAKTAKVTFKGALPKDVDFSNFEINGEKVVTEAKVSENRLSAEITVNSDFVRNQEYTLTVTGVKDAEGKVYADTTGKFTWTVQEGVTVGLEKTTVEQGEKFGLTVKDTSGKDVKDATVKVKSFNTNLLDVVTATGTPNQIKFVAKDLAGEVEVEVETTLIDGTVLTNTFKVSVKEPVVNIADKGYAFVTTALTTPVANGTDFEYANTAAFQKFASPTTKLVEGKAAQYFYAYSETNGNPDDAHIDWKKADKVTSSNAITATALLDKTAGTILVTPNKVGTTTLTVTFDDKTKRTFNIEVTANPVFKDLFVSQTAVKLSDEAKNGGKVDGVNKQAVKLYGLDQFKKLLNPSDGKVVISTNTKEGLNLAATAASTDVPADNTVTLNATQLAALTSTSDVFSIEAEPGKPVKDAKVTINYFAKSTDAKPSITKTINVNVTDVDATVKASGLDLILTHTEIDANGDNNLATEVDLDFAAPEQEAYLLDATGNRIGTTAVSKAEYQTVADKNVGVDALATKIEFSDVNAQTYLRSANTVTVQVTANDIGTDSSQEIKKNVAVKYENTAVLPNKATVKTNAVSLKLADSVDTISLEQILFGIGDVDQLKTDDAVAIAVLKNAKNAGYKYNQPLVTVTGTNGKTLPMGVSLYGSTATEYATASQWNNAFTNAELLTTPFAADAFDFEYEVTNIVASDATATVDASGSGNVVVPAKESATFTLVVKAIYIEGDAKATSEQKAKNNLLATPVQLNVSVEGANQ